MFLVSDDLISVIVVCSPVYCVKCVECVADLFCFLLRVFFSNLKLLFVTMLEFVIYSEFHK